MAEKVAAVFERQDMISEEVVDSTIFKRLWQMLHESWNRGLCFCRVGRTSWASYQAVGLWSLGGMAIDFPTPTELLDFDTLQSLDHSEVID